MGVRDYACYIHSMGSQIICTHEDCQGELPNVSGDNDYDGHDDTVGGSDWACLIMFDVNEDVEKPQKVLELFIRGYAKNVSAYQVEYDWDHWDFDDGMGYSDVLSEDCEDLNAAMWRCNNPEHIKKYKRNGPFWVLNICPMCYSMFVEPNIVIPQKLCSMYYCELAERHNIDLKQNNEKSQLYINIWRRYQWLRNYK